MIVPAVFVGDAPREEEGCCCTLIPVPTIALALRPLLFNVGEFAADERLDIRGIFVGVSLVNDDEIFNADNGGASFASLVG